jgi:paraquat-inducible protein A
MPAAPLIACPECDLLQYETPLPRGSFACCHRCGIALYRRTSGSIDRSLALTLAAAALMIVANTLPIASIEVRGERIETTLLGAVQVLYDQRRELVAALVFATTILAPAIELCAMLYMLLPLRIGRVPPHLSLAFRLAPVAREWGLIDVFMLGVVVSLIKLGNLADVVLGTALWSFGFLILLLTSIGVFFNPRELWSDAATYQGGAQPAPEARASVRGVAVVSAATATAPAAAPALPAAPTAEEAGLLSCMSCTLVSRPPPSFADDALEAGARCPRCGTRLHWRKPESVQRCWAFLLAAYVLYVPANVLPIMNTSSLFGAQNDTILSGVIYLWNTGSWATALVVFVASIAVPILKLIVLTWLVVSVQGKSTWRPKLRARMYSIVSFVGRWSMLDIFVVTVLVALVQIKSVAVIEAGPRRARFRRRGHPDDLRGEQLRPAPDLGSGPPRLWTRRRLTAEQEPGARALACHGAPATPEQPRVLGQSETRSTGRHGSIRRSRRRVVRPPEAASLVVCQIPAFAIVFALWALICPAAGARTDDHERPSEAARASRRAYQDQVQNVDIVRRVRTVTLSETCRSVIVSAV